MRRDQLFQLLHHHAATAFRAAAMDQHRERVHRFGVDEDRHLYKVALLVAGDGVVKAGVAFRDRLQAIIEIEHHFVQRQLVDHHRALADVIEIDLHAAPLLTEF